MILYYLFMRQRHALLRLLLYYHLCPHVRLSCRGVLGHHLTPNEENFHRLTQEMKNDDWHWSTKIVILGGLGHAFSIELFRKPPRKTLDGKDSQAYWQHIVSTYPLVNLRLLLDRRRLCYRYPQHWSACWCLRLIYPLTPTLQKIKIINTQIGRCQNKKNNHITLHPQTNNIQSKDNHTITN